MKIAVQSSLKLAADQGFTSSGIFGFLKDICAKIMIGELKRFLEDGMNNTSIQMIEFCILDDETLRYFRSEFDRELQSVDLND